MAVLQNTPSLLLCTDGGGTQTIVSAKKAYQDYDGKPSPLLALSGWGLLTPAALVANLVHSKLPGARDTLLDTDRIASAKFEEKRQILSLRMKNARDLRAWVDAAENLDVLEDNETWKSDLDSTEFDVSLLQTRLRQLDEARICCDVRRMLYLVRTALSRDLGGMDNIQLYKHSHIGTKHLIEEYIDSAVATIRALVKTSKLTLPEGLESKDIMEQVVYARQAFGRSALLLSGGATFGMNHIGVLKALFEAKLLPRIISGASAGSIVCAVLCTRTDEEIPEVLDEFPYRDLAVFEEAGNEDSVLGRLRRLLTQGVWIDIKHLKRVMWELLGDMTFQESYNRTRRILNICVSSASIYELPRLLNYVTAPDVMIWSAVAASCSVPFLFSAAELLVKNPVTGENSSWNPTPQHWIDGSVDNDLPMNRLAEMFNVNHFIVSQVNPHIVPFIARDEEAIARDANSPVDSGPGWIYTLTNLAKHEALHRMHILSDLGIFPNLVTKARSILSQKYSGDITILPQVDYRDFPRMLKNPSAEFMVTTCLCGERATWPKLSRIRNRCVIELELDAAVQELRARVVFSPSQADLRRMTTGSYQGSPQRMGRRRGDSGGALQSMLLLSGSGDEENVHNSRQSVSRPPALPWSRTTSSQIVKRYGSIPYSSHGIPLYTEENSIAGKTRATRLYSVPLLKETLGLMGDMLSKSFPSLHSASPSPEPKELLGYPEGTITPNKRKSTIPRLSEDADSENTIAKRASP
ncbi:patatin family phospholipase-like protein [Calycina marina]|uniref:Patatin-like phospholipase domain-containing protein n=1 Tax=Calycina marina TaxID=1763456 RepID=A0A9P7Z1B8_9HELO|nr:patatin family phospholipase-like protein [Calycina marina]